MTNGDHKTGANRFEVVITDPTLQGEFILSIVQISNPSGRAMITERWIIRAMAAWRRVWSIALSCA